MSGDVVVEWENGSIGVVVANVHVDIDIDDGDEVGHGCDRSIEYRH
jgi:hypothetical protein